MGTIIGLISIKGGVGKTTTTLNLGAVLAKYYGQKVLLVDANFSAPNLGLHLGIDNPDKTLHDVLLGRANFKEAIREYSDNLFVLPGSIMGRKIHPSLLKEKLKSIKNDYDIILLDSSPSLNEEMLATMIASDKLLVITTPDNPTLRTTARAVRLAKQKKTPISGIIINKVKGKNFELSAEAIEQAAETPVLAVLPDDIRVLEGLAHTKHIADFAPNRDIVYEYRKLAACIIGTEYYDQRFIKQFKRIFRKDLPREEVNRLQLMDYFRN